MSLPPRSVCAPLIAVLAVACAPGSPAGSDAAAAPAASKPTRTEGYGAGFGDTSFRAADRVDAISLSNRDELYTLDVEGGILRFALPSGERIGAVDNPCETPRYSEAIAVSPNGSLLAVGCSREVRITRVGSGTWATSEPLDLGGVAHVLEWAPEGDVLMVNGSASWLLDAEARTVARVERSAPLLPITAELWMGTHDYDGVAPVRGWTKAGEQWSANVPLGTYEAVRGIARVAGKAPLAVLTDREVHWFKPDGTFVTTSNGSGACCDGPVVGVGAELWVHRGRVIARLSPEGGVIGEIETFGRTLAASPDGRYAAAADLGRVDVFRGDGTRLTPTDSLGGRVEELRWSLDGGAVAATDGARVARIDVKKKTLEVRALPGIESLAWGPGGMLAMGGRPGIWIWGSPPTPVPTEVDVPNGVLFEPDGTLRTFTWTRTPTGESTRMDRWATAPLKKLSESPVGRCFFDTALLSADGRHIAALPNSADDACVVDAATGANVGSLGDTDDLVWLPDGRALVIASIGDDIDNAELWTWPGERPRTSSRWPPAWHATVAPDGRTVAGWHEGTLTVWDIPTKAALTTMTGPQPSRMRFSPDSRSLAIGTGDGLVRIVATGR